MRWAKQNSVTGRRAVAGNQPSQQGAEQATACRHHDGRPLPRRRPAPPLPLLRVFVAGSFSLFIVLTLDFEGGFFREF